MTFISLGGKRIKNYTLFKFYDNQEKSNQGDLRKDKSFQSLWSDGWISKMWYLHTMGYYFAFKKQILTYATTLVNREDIMLSEWSQL